MKCYRVTSSKYSDLQSVWDAIGSIEGGRWNKRKTKAIYTASNYQVAVAEKSFYKIIPKVEAIKGESSPNYLFEECTNVPFVLLELDINGLQKDLINLTKKVTLEDWLSKAGLKKYSVSDSRKSPYDFLPERWTMKLADYLRQQDTKGITAKSARSDLSNNHIFYPTNLLLEEINIISQKDINISAIDSKNRTYEQVGKKIKFIKNKVLLDIDKRYEIIDILNFPI